MIQPYFTVGDTAPALSGTCTNNGVGTSLVGATLQALITKPSGKSMTITALPVDAQNGTWEYQWQNGDIDEAGSWSVRMEVTYSDTTRQTFGPAIFTVQE